MEFLCQAGGIGKVGFGDEEALTMGEVENAPSSRGDAVSGGRIASSV